MWKQCILGLLITSVIWVTPDPVALAKRPINYAAPELEAEEALSDASDEYVRLDSSMVPKKAAPVAPVAPAQRADQGLSPAINLNSYRNILKANPYVDWAKPRQLYLYNRRTRETYNMIYWQNGQLDLGAYQAFNRFMRDDRQNLMVDMDPQLMDVLFSMQSFFRHYNWNRPLIILSGYRSPQTNAMLRSTNKEAPAKMSMHMYGKAADIYMEGVPQSYMGSLAQYLMDGGVGFYPASSFTHVDTGKKRVWFGRAAGK